MLISEKNHTRLASQLCEARVNAGITYSDNPRPGCYYVAFKNRATGILYRTQGDIPFRGSYGWKEYLEWLIADMEEADGDIDSIDILDIEYAGTENMCEDIVSISVFRDTTNLYTTDEIDEDNLCDLIFPLEIVEEYYRQQGNKSVDFKDWLSTYTADETTTLYDFAKSKGCNILREES